jgi:23S rRNA pseudouridine1911/1915/1917 synthase
MSMEEFRVETGGVRLDQYLADHVPRLSRSRLQALIKEGRITLNGSTTRSSEKVRTGDVITLDEPAVIPSTTEAEDIALSVLYEDDDLIVINKPPGLVVHPAAGHASGTLVNALLHHCDELSGIGGVERPGIVHRLDKETSGCLVAAKNDLAHQALVTQFAGREVTKIYLAIAAGKLPRREGMIDAPIGRHRVHRQKMSVVKEGQGKEARTGWKVLADLPAGTLVECTLHTGRTHQIRVHLKHLGNPLLGDTVYGKPAGFTRQMLHAWKLGFNHPRTGVRIDCVAPIPDDFRAAGVTMIP